MSDFIKCSGRRCVWVGAGLAALALVGCGTVYQCDVYSLSDGSRIDTLWYEAGSAGEAEDICEEEFSISDCECYEDN